MVRCSTMACCPQDFHRFPGWQVCEGYCGAAAAWPVGNGGEGGCGDGVAAD